MAKPPGRCEMKTIKENEMIIGVYKLARKYHAGASGRYMRLRQAAMLAQPLHMLIDEGFIVRKGSCYIEKSSSRSIKAGQQIRSVVRLFTFCIGYITAIWSSLSTVPRSSIPQDASTRISGSVRCIYTHPYNRVVYIRVGDEYPRREIAFMWSSSVYGYEKIYSL